MSLKFNFFELHRTLKSELRRAGGRAVCFLFGQVPPRRVSVFFSTGKDFQKKDLPFFYYSIIKGVRNCFCNY
jgi:hypothetical protein